MEQGLLRLVQYGCIHCHYDRTPQVVTGQKRIAGPEQVLRRRLAAQEVGEKLLRLQEITKKTTRAACRDNGRISWGLWVPASADGCE